MSRLRSLQVTPLYVVTIAAVYVAIDPARRTAVVHANSTNVANLLHGQWYTLLTSAVLLAGRDCLPVLLLVGVVIGIGELTIGRSGVIAVFWYGHVVASLLVFAGIATGTSLHELCQRLAFAPDVGPSYGAVAVLGRLLVHQALRRPATWQITAVLLALAATALHRTFTDAGHLTALMLGLAAGHAVHRRRDGPRRSAVPTASPNSTPRSPEPLACGVSSGPGEVPGWVGCICQAVRDGEYPGMLRTRTRAPPLPAHQHAPPSVHRRVAPFLSAAPATAG